MIRPILVPKVWHLRDLHMFSSVTSHKLMIQQSVEGELRQHDGMMTVTMKLPVQGFAKHYDDMAEVDYGGGGHRTRLGTINLCVLGCPLPPYIKEWRRGRAGPLYGAP